jgi:hypothetical protein
MANNGFRKYGKCEKNTEFSKNWFFCDDLAIGCFLYVKFKSTYLVPVALSAQVHAPVIFDQWQISAWHFFLSYFLAFPKHPYTAG